MAKFPIKCVVSFLQKRSFQTKPRLLKQSAQKQIEIIKTEETSPPVERKGKSVIALLKNHNFSEIQIAKLIERFPRILNARISTNLEPKLKFLNENGFTGNLLPQLIISNPAILRRSLNSHLIPSFDFLKTQLGENNVLALHTVIKRASWILTSDLEKVLGINVAFLEKQGMPMSSILKLFTSQPRSLLHTENRMLYGVRTVKGFGIMPHESMFVYALRVILSMDESKLKRKMEVFKSLGWSDEDFVSSVVHQPLCLTCSVEKLKSNVEFLVKTMKFELKRVVANPKLVMYSLEKRIIPRFNVLKLLQEEKLVKEKNITSIINLINIPERDFVRIYLVKYVDRVPRLLDVYYGGRKLDALATSILHSST